MIDWNAVLWVAAIVVGAIIVFIIVKYFFQHLLPFLLRGCGCVILIIIFLLFLHYLKVF
jgi:hypothetical protein